MAELILLNRIRVDIGNVSGSLSELLQYAGMSGFNDEGEEQAKPRLVGTWTINDWYTAAQLAEAQAAFDGLTVVGDPNYLINFNDLAVQVLDPNEDNYNPAVAIILQGQNLGTTMTNAPLGHGRWFMTKTQAAAITSIGNWFEEKTNIQDTKSLVTSDATQTYTFESFDEFKYFNSITILQDCFNGCTKITKITLPLSITTIKNAGVYYKGCFRNCSNLVEINLHNNITYIGSCAFAGCRKVEIEELPLNLSTLGSECFLNCSKITIERIPDLVLSIPASCFEECFSITSLNLNNVKTIGADAFYNCSNLKDIIFSKDLTSIANASVYYKGCFRGCNKLKTVYLYDEITYIGSNCFINIPLTFLHIESETASVTTSTFSGQYPIYVGDGSSAAHDDAILADYLADTNWATYSSRLNTWYNYLHPTT